MTDDPILAQQLAYYRARAPEYNAAVAAAPPSTAAVEAAEAQRIRDALLALGPVRQALDLACGTGLWTHHLLTISAHVTALDGAPEMLTLHQQRFGGDARITYQCADLFTWKPAQQYDLVCRTFWLSHVPPDRLHAFCAMVARTGVYRRPTRHSTGLVTPAQYRNLPSPHACRWAAVYDCEGLL
jgi:2-polyprenyl-3-methyl-5-hydroxy-6-metoxy-1,4-benzoquinol methylase